MNTLAVTGSKFKSKVRSSKGLIPPDAAEEAAAADVAAEGPRDEVEPITFIAISPTCNKKSNRKYCVIVDKETRERIREMEKYGDT